MKILDDHRWSLFGLLGLLLIFGVMFLFAIAGWPGKLDDLADPVTKAPGKGEPNCPGEEVVTYKDRDNARVNAVVYGETVHWDSAIKQRSSTFSNLFAVGIGFLILWLLENQAAAGEKALPNPMASLSFFSILYGYLVIFLGPGSMFLHASMTAWGGVIDNLSMYMYISMLLIYAVTRLGRIEVETIESRAIFLVVWGLLNLGLVIILIANLPKEGQQGAPSSLSKIIFAALIGLTVLVEGVHWLTRVLGRNNSAMRQVPVFGVLFALRGRWRTWSLFWNGMLLFLIAFVIWLDSQCKCCPLYKPDAVVTGHAIWHMGAGGSALLFWLYFKSEYEA